MSFRRLGLCVLTAALSFSCGVSAQEAGSISGTVTDSSGAVIPGATVKVTNNAGQSQTIATHDHGEYSMVGLSPGTYSVTISQPGFKDFQASAITLEAGQKARLDATLEPAGEVTSVKVAGEKAAVVETQSAQITGTITQKELTSIGLNGRNFTQLITLAPGVSNQTGQDEALVGVKGSVKYSVNGGRVEYNTFDVDGSDVLNPGINGSQSTLIVFPSLDAIREVKVLTSNYGAIYGRSASGTVLVATKSGTSQIHGDAYEFVRNEVFNARNFFDETYGAPLYRRNDFGFTLGGPVFIPHFYNRNKEKTFFFVSEEFRREKTPQDFNQGVPSVSERNGDFSDVCPFAEPGQNGLPGQQVIFARSAFPDCPAIHPAPAELGGAALGFFQTFPGNQVPIDSNAQVLLGTGIIPAPNSTVGCNSTINSCYDAAVSPPTHWREELFRIDHNISSNLRTTFRYIHDSWDTTNTTPIWGFVQNSFPTIQNRFVGPGISMVARVTHVISPAFLNEYVLSYASDHIRLTDINGPGASFQRPDGLSVGYLFNNGFGGKVPGIVIGGTNAAYGGFGFAVDPSFEPWEHSNPTFTFRDDAGKVAGKHTLGFGVHLVFGQKNEFDTASAANTGDVQGILTFSNVNSLNTTGNAFADFLAGDIRSFQQDSTSLKYYNRYRSAEPYFQDDWRILPRLTVNLGVRLNIFGLYHEKYLKAFNWVPGAYNSSIAPGVDSFHGFLVDPNQQPIPLDLSNLDPRITNGLVQCGKNAIPASCAATHHAISVLNPAPRVGFAWDLRGDGRTSVRGGYGIFFYRGTGNEANTGSLEGSAPLVLDMTQNNPFGYACIGGVGSGCGFAAAAYPLNVTAIPTRTVWPYVQQWSLSIQRVLPKSMVTTLAYVGSKGTHLTAERQLNQLTPVTPSDNPFGPGQPVSTAVCNTFDGLSFSFGDTKLTSGQPAFINLEAACFGVKLTGSHAGVQFPDVNSLRQFAPGLGQVFSLENVANSHYNAFQATLRRTQGPLNLDVVYTFGRSADDSSDRFDSTLVDSFNLRSNYAASNFDQRHLLNVGYVYELPSLANWARLLGFLYKSDTQLATPYKPSEFWRKLLEGWELSGVTTYQTGTPFSVINGGSAVNGISVLDNAGVANGIGAGSYPDLIDNPYGTAAPKAGNNSKSFGPILGNPNAFGAPRGLTFGTAGRNVLRNPSRWNFDMALLKHFKFGEFATLELRGEAFNIFNHTQFRIYNPDRGSTGSNTISCYGGPKNSAGFVDANGGANCLVGSAFLHPVDAHRPRTIQLGVKLIF